MDNLYAQLSQPMPEESLSEDVSRGFALTSIKAAFVFERLNSVFGLYGTGWRFASSPPEMVGQEVSTEVALQYRVAEHGIGAVEWVPAIQGWVYNSDESWSYPAYAHGGKQPGKGGTPQTDARKSAVTDGLTKACSMLGVGVEVFKGERKPKGRSAPVSRKPVEKTVPTEEATPQKSVARKASSIPDTKSKADATSFWKYVRSAFKEVPSAVNELPIAVSAGDITWDQALEKAKELSS